jgi:sec-independent protein translocase protein TatA
MITDLSLNIMGSEWIVILLLAMFLLFGSKKMPQVGRTIGKVIGEYQRAKNVIQDEITKTSRMVNTPVIKPDGTVNSTARNVSTNEVSAPVSSVSASTSSAVDAGSSAPMTGPVATEREKLEIIAKTLDIEYRGKSDDELRQLIANKMNQ